MTFSTGFRLGPYEILSPIGAGGMGEVYKAKDTRLERTVAVKVLPAHLSASPEVRQRFEREAKTISQLSHPHICALYDVGREGETEYLVMEYLEGETLSERLAKGVLALDQTLRYGIEIADALDKAHRQGIVHRDLKPSNVMLTKAGVKLLDFGLAKAIAPGESMKSGLTSLPTIAGSPNLTQEGTILGTFQYMAPEQLEGKDADARTDIFAFGAVLYEMATGRKAFSGSSQASLITAIMSSEPTPISSIQPMSPAALDRVVKTCLAKDPEDRWQSAQDARKELKWIAEGSTAEPVAPVLVAPRRRSLDWIAWSGFAIVGLFAAILAAALLRQVARSRDVRPVRAFITAPEKTAFRFTFAGGPPALSPDGRKIVFSATTSDGKPLLWVRPLESLAAQPLPGTEDAVFPFWSPDGRFVGFFAGTKLKKIEASGGRPATLCEVSEGGRGGSWSRENTILFSGRYTPVYRVPADGGDPVAITELNAARKDTTHRWPLWLPDGRRFLYLASETGSEGEGNAIFIASLDGKENRLLLNVSSNVAYASGHLLFAQERTLMAQRFDAGSARLMGDPFPIAEVQFDALYSRAVFSASDFALVYQTGWVVPEAELVWYDRAGRLLGSLQRPGKTRDDIWILPLSGDRKPFPFLRSEFSERGAQFSPDGNWLAFVSNESGRFEVYVAPFPGPGAKLQISTSGGNSPRWRRDGREIFYVAPDRKLMAARVETSPAFRIGAVQALFQTPRPEAPGVSYDASADGKRFLLANIQSEKVSPPITLVLNWTAELKK
jgi:Tol biopolymer transport system component/predicted Ser/Thr protein kinase